MANPTNKWSQPLAPPAPMFFGKKERDLVKQVNDELAERVIGQPVAYYPISIEASNFSDIYGESIDKVSLPPVRIFAYVVVENEQSNERYGYEYQTKLTVNFHRKRLVDDQNLYVRVGDFVQYGTEFYEIVRTYNDTRYYFGQVEHKFQISAECIRARTDAFRVVPGITRPTDAAVLADGSAAAAPRPAPYPPLDASYVVLSANGKLPRERVLTAGTNIAVTDAGANSTVTIGTTDNMIVSGNLTVGGFLSGSSPLEVSRGMNIVNSTGTIISRFGSSSLGPNVLSGAVGLLTNLTASEFVSASFFYGDGGGITNLPAAAISSYTLSGNDRLITSVNATAVQGEANLTFDGSVLNVIGQLTASSTISASSFHGDGSALAGIGGTPGGATTQVQFNNAGAFGGSSNFTFDGTSVTGSFTGSLAQIATVSASLMNLSPTSGTLAGGGSYLGLDVNNNVILSAGDGATTSPAAPVNSIQFNDASSFGGSSNLTFDGTTVAVTGDISASAHVSASAFVTENYVGFEYPADGGAGTGNYMDFTTDDEINFWAGGQRLLRLNEAGSSSEVVSGDGGHVNFRAATQGFGYNFYVKSSNAGGVNNAVGIRESSPQAVLHLSGADEDLFRVDGDGGTGILFVDGDPGRVGVGTITPTAALHVSSSTDGVALRVDGLTAAAPILYVTGSGFVDTLFSTGRVGINTDSPSDLLTVVGPTGSWSTNARINVSGNANSSPGYAINRDGLGVPHTIFDSSNNLALQTGAGIQFNTNGANPRMLIESGGDIVVGQPNFGLEFGSTLEVVHSGFNLATIGCTQYTNTNPADGPNRHFARAGSTGTPLVEDGWVLGATDYYGHDGSNWINAARIMGEVDGTAATTDMPGRLVFKTTPAGTTVAQERMRITNAGNIGIGEINPSASLHVSSSGDQQLFRVDGATNGNVLFVTGSGRVGIGTASPGHTLTTIGNTHLSGGLVHNRTGITAATYTLLLTDYYIGVDTTSNPVALTVPAASTATAGQTYMIKDEGGNAGVNSITVSRSSPDTIDGATSFTITSPYGSTALYTDGSNWFIY